MAVHAKLPVQKIGGLLRRAYDTARRPGVWQLLLIAIALVVVLVIPVPGKQVDTPAPTPAFVPSEVITYTTDTPDESPIKRESFTWVGADDEPKHIRFASINTEGFIQKMGVDQKGQLSAPTNINLAGWFINSAKPGQPGLSIIDGHVDGRQNAGIFKRLGDLKQGDVFELELGGGTELSYRVLQVQTVDVAGAENTLFSQDPTVKSQLNLITCGGNFNRESQLYEKRVIVSSELMQ